MLAPKPNVVTSSVSVRRVALALSISLFFVVGALLVPRSSRGDPEAAKPELTAQEEIAALLTAIRASG